MRFLSGLKKLFKKPLLTIILLLFIISWISILIGTTLVPYPPFVSFVIFFSGILAGFIFVLLVFSIFMSIDKMGTITIIIAMLLTIPVLIIFSGIIIFFYAFCFFANLFLIALFAYKWCMDNSIKVDYFLYDKKGSRKITRPIEFFTFLIISTFLLIMTIGFFRDNLGLNIVANIFLYVSAIDLILLIFVVLRIIIVQKLAAYISLFYLLSYLYILYVIIDLWSIFIFGGSVSPNIGYEFISFGIDLTIFLFIMGSIFDRIDYLKEKLHVFRADTLALFVMLMKIIVKIVEIAIQQNPVTLPGFELFQAIIVLFYFTFFTVILGIYSIIFHKEGKK